MKAIDSFRKNIDRCRVLLALHLSKWPTRPAREGDDLLRAVVVLTVSALDSYMHDIILEYGPKLIIAYSKGKTNAPGKLFEALKPELSPEKIFQLLGRKRWDEEVRKLVGKYIGDRTYQNPSEIEKALKLIKIDDFWEDLKKKLRFRTKEKTKKYVVPYVNRRHQIVHEADTFKSKKYHDQLRGISRTYTNDCVRSIDKFVTALEHVVQAKLTKEIQDVG